MGGATNALADISVDTSVDTRSSTFDILVEYRLMYQPILLSVDIFDGLPILHRCFTDTLPSLNVLVDIGRYIS